MDQTEAGRTADEIIAGELARQDKMWGEANDRSDVTKGQLLQAGVAQAFALLRRYEGNSAFDQAPTMYPRDWSGFRDYGSDVANLAVAAAFLRQEMKRLIASGASTERTSRNQATQPYGEARPNQTA